MRDLRDFWREQDRNPMSFLEAVQRAYATLEEGAWCCLIFAVEGLLLHRTFEQMIGKQPPPVDLDKCQHALRTMSLAYSAPTDRIKRPRVRQSNPPAGRTSSTAWGPRELACLGALAEGGVRSANLAAGSTSALQVLELLRAGLAAARARQSKPRTRASARAAGRRQGTSATSRARCSAASHDHG
jgi:hypothetical protein